MRMPQPGKWMDCFGAIGFLVLFCGVGSLLIEVLTASDYSADVDGAGMLWELKITAAFIAVGSVLIVGYGLLGLDEE